MRASKDARLSTGYGDEAIQRTKGAPTIPGLLRFARNAGWTAPDGICCAKLRVHFPSEETVRHASYHNRARYRQERLSGSAGLERHQARRKLGGWDKVVGDLWTLNRLIAAEQPGTPIVLLGHSLGSFLARGFIGEHSGALAGVALSGSSGRPPMIATLGRLIAREERLRLGKRGKSDPVFQMWFGDFNKPFKPARTPFDWLSRDEKEVDAYVEDPFCGFPFTTQLAIDVLDALPRVTSRESLARIRKDLPIYVFSGERDPVGANIQGLIADLKAMAFTQLTIRLYPGARHETLNETNRDEVTRDLVAWLDGAGR